MLSALLGLVVELVDKETQVLLVLRVAAAEAAMVLLVLRVGQEAAEAAMVLHTQLPAHL